MSYLMDYGDDCRLAALPPPHQKENVMTTHTGEHVYRLTNRQRFILAAVIVGILLGPAGMLFAALHAHGPAPQTPPAPSPVVVIGA